MDLFQRLLGTLQRTVDYISIFTTYLLGDDAHPRPDGSGSTKETVPCRSHNDGEVETAPYGDISPRGNLEAFEKSPIAEIIPPSKEIQEASGKVFSSVQPTESIVGTSELSCKDEEQEDVGWKFSEPPTLLPGAPKPRSSTTGSVLHRDLEGLTVTEELQQWELGSTTRMGAGQLELEEAMSDKNNWKPEKLLAGGQEREELGRAGEAERTLQKEGKEEDEQERPGGVESDGEEQRGLNGVWPGRFQDEVAKMAEDLQSEPDRQLIGGATMEGDQQEEPDIEAGEGGVQLAVPASAECRGDQQEGPEGEAEAGSSPQWEPEEMVTLEVQKEDPKEVAKTGDDQQRGLEEAETEKPQPRELEIFERNEGTQQEENEGDEQEEPGRAESDREEQRGLNGAAWPGRFQQEVAKMVEDLRSEPCGLLIGGANMEGDQQEEPDIEAGEGGVQAAVPESAESERDQWGGPEGEAEAESSPEWEPEEMVTLKVQEEDPKEVAKTGDGQPRRKEEAEMEEPQPMEPELFERNEETQQQEEEEGDDQGETGRAESDREEQRGLNGAAWPGRFQHEVAKMAEDLRSEPCGQLVGGETMEGDQQEEPDIEAGEGGVQPAVPESAESERDQWGGPEGEAEAESSPEWEPEEMVTLKVQEEDPKEVAKTGDGQPRRKEEAEMEEPQPMEPELFERNEETQQQEEEEGDDQGETGRAESDREEQRGLNGAAWPGRFQHEVAKMAEDLRSEPCGQLVGGATMEGDQQEEPDVEAGDEGVQPESGGEEQGGPEGEAEAGSSSQWEPEQEAAGGEEPGMEEQRDGTAWAGRPEQEVATVVEDQLLEAEGPLEGGSEAERFRHRRPAVKTGDERARHTMLDGAGMRGDLQRGQEAEAEEGRDLQWEPEEAVTLEEHPERGEGQQQGLEGAEKREGHQCRGPEGLARNEVKAEEEEQEEQTGEAELEKDPKTAPEALVGITVLEEVAGAEAMEEPGAQGQEPREADPTERSLLREPLGYKGAVDTCGFAGAGLSSDKVSLDMTAQKERVLLNRKSSVRRAPSLKRPRPPIETSPQQETSTEENSRPPPPTHARPNLRHAGFGPMHPNMMAELQTRLRRPQ